MNLYRFSAAVSAAAVLLMCCTGCSSEDIRNVDFPAVSVEDSGAVISENISSADDMVYIPQEIIPEGASPEGASPNDAPSEDTPSGSTAHESSVPESADSSLPTGASADTAPEERVPQVSTTATVPTTQYDPPEVPTPVVDKGYVFTEEGEVLDTYYLPDYAAYDITSADREFTKESIFVGDSICKGFSEFRVVGSKRVYARGNLGARSFFDYDFYYGEDYEEIDYSELLSRTQPKYVFLSMGMNDINMTDEQQFCENYAKIIDKTLAESEAAVYVCAITPVNSKFTTNYRVDCFNLAIQQYIKDNYPERVYFVDFGKHLRNEDGDLRESLTSGDGIHLAPYAYYIALWEINRTTKADGLR